MTKSVMMLFILLAMMILVPFAVATSPPEPQTMLERLERQGVRAIWIWAGGGGHFAKPLAASGINTASIQSSPLDGVAEKLTQGQPLRVTRNQLNGEALTRMRQAVTSASQAGIVPLISLYHLNDVDAGVLKKMNYRRAVTGDGRQGDVAPCPLEQRYWHGVVLPQWLAVAEALAEAGTLGGVTMENEAYAAGTIYPGYWDPKLRLCYCDSCMTAFLASQGRAGVALPTVAQRGHWVLEQGLAIAHRNFMQEAFTGIIKEMADEARRVHPWFLVAQYPYFPGWFCDGVIQGASNGELPVVLFSHVEYFGGYNAALTAGHLAHPRQNGSHVLYAGGLTVGWYWPTECAVSQVELGEQADGWWVYWGGSMLDGNYHQRLPDAPDFGKLSWEYRLLGRPELYWQAMLRGCQWLDKARQADGTADIPVSGTRQTPVLTAADFVGQRNVRLAGDRVIVNAEGILETSLLPGWERPADKTRWEQLHRMKIDPQVRHNEEPALVFGPFDQPGAAASEYIQTSVQAPKGRRLLLSCWYRAEGPDPQAFVGLGKMNWYWHFPVTGDTGGQWRRLEEVLESRPVEHMLTDGHRETSDSMTIRLHVLPTRNRMWLSNVRLEPIEEVEMRTGATGYFHVPDGSTLLELRWPEPPPGRALRVDLYADDAEQPLVRDYRPGQNLRPLVEAFGVRSLRAVVTARLTAGAPVLEITNPQWVTAPLDGQASSD